MDLIVFCISFVALVLLLSIFIIASINAFNTLRTNGVNIFEAIFLAFIYSVTFLLCRGQDYRSEMQITRENLWKQFGLLLILALGAGIIIFIYTAPIRGLTFI